MSRENQMGSPCIWMSAGILNYKLCDMDFQCEKCKFHEMMRGIFPYRDGQNKEGGTGSMFSFYDYKNRTELYMNTYFSGCSIFLDRYYEKSSFWSQYETERVYKIGINKLCLKILQPVTRIVLPQSGRYFHSNQLLAWIIRRGETIPLYAPYAGIIESLNPDLDSNETEDLINNDNYLFRLRLSENRKNEHIFNYSQSLNNVSQLVGKVYKFVEEIVCEQKKHSGLTMADGGNFELDLERICSPEQYSAFIKRIFVRP